jgi:hypothetical protein
MAYSRVPEEEIILRGREIYERDVRPRLGPEHEGKFVEIDVATGDYEVSEDDGKAFDHAEAKRPEAVFRPPGRHYRSQRTMGTIAGRNYPAPEERTRVRSTDPDNALLLRPRRCSWRQTLRGEP